MTTYRIQLAWSLGGGLVYSPGDQASPWVPSQLDAMVVPHSILMALLSEAGGWWGGAHLDDAARPWGCKAWDRIDDPVTPELAALIATDCAEALKPLQRVGMLGDVEAVASVVAPGSIQVEIVFERPADGGGRYAASWEAYRGVLNA